MFTEHAAALRLTEEAVVSLRLADLRTGTTAERYRLALLEGQLQESLAARDDIWFGGRDIGEGFCSFYLFGASAARAYEAVREIVADFRPASGSYVELRRAEGGSAERERIELV